MSNKLASAANTGFTPDRLLVGCDYLSEKVTLLSGENRARGALLGRKATAGTIAGAADAGNTSGSGAIGSLTIGAAARLGVYRAVCIAAASNAGTFAVYDPDGVFIGHATVAVAFTGAVNFTIADATDFVVGDFFTITVSAITYKYLLSVATATDGSQIPIGILVDDCDASAGDAEAELYTFGQFDDSAVTYGSGHTAAIVRGNLRLRGIYLITTVGGA